MIFARRSRSACAARAIARCMASGRLRRRGLVLAAAAYAAAGTAIVVLNTLRPRDGAGEPLGLAGEVLSNIFGALAVGVVITACLHLRHVRRLPYTAPSPFPPAPDPAVAAALGARARRTQARELVVRDPLLAHDLRIGRPDLVRTYDDGGLVDLNAAPATAIADICGIELGHADQIVETRTVVGVPFATVDDALHACGVPVSEWDRIRERAITAP